MGMQDNFLKLFAFETLGSTGREPISALIFGIIAI